MKKFLFSVFDFVKKDFHAGLYLSVFLFTSTLILIEYIYFPYDKLTNKYNLEFKVYFINFFWFFFSYGITLLIIKIFRKNEIKINLELFFKVFVAILILSVYISYFGQYGIDIKIPYPEKFYFYQVFDNFSGLVTIVIPLSLIWYFLDKESVPDFYGLRFYGIRLFPLGILILTVVAISFIGSFFKDVSKYYPILERTYYKIFANELGVSKVFTAIGFEIAYMFDFFIIELFFRGFMILGLIKLLGRNSILPVSVLYVVIHFGKPLPETISSFFGAYFLGIIAFEEKHIWWGVILHCLLALAMEIFTLS